MAKDKSERWNTKRTKLETNKVKVSRNNERDTEVFISISSRYGTGWATFSAVEARDIITAINAAIAEAGTIAAEPEYLTPTLKDLPVGAVIKFSGEKQAWFKSRSEWVHASGAKSKLSSFEEDFRNWTFDVILPKEDED